MPHIACVCLEIAFTKSNNTCFKVVYTILTDSYGFKIQNQSFA